MRQVQRYCEVIADLKSRDLRRTVEGMYHAVAAGMGNMKANVFEDYIEKICPSEKMSSKKSLEIMKSEGLPVEER